MTRYRPRPRFSPRSPGARLQALRAALRDEDEALEWVLATAQALCVGNVSKGRLGDALMVLANKMTLRMERERQLWEASA